MKYCFPFIFILLLMYSCSGSGEEKNNKEKSESVKNIEFYGNTQGTTFTVLCNDDIAITFEEIEGVLHDFDLALSGYIPNSILTLLNEAPAGDFIYRDEFGYFNRCYELAQNIFNLTDGAFDPTVGPLLEIWGFRQDIDAIPDSSVVDSLRSFIGFTDGLHFSYQADYKKDSSGQVSSRIVKISPQAQLDFNGIAQGLAVDVLAEELERRGAKNYMIEIGGEFRLKGLNSDGVYWRIGIDQPIEGSTAENREIQEIVEMNGRSIATSGSYRQFYEKDGIKYSHTVNPKTGRPVQHSLLSATVIADDCGTADAMATAFMVMGADKTMDFIANHPELNLEVYLIFTNAKGRMETYYSKGFGELLVD